MAIVFFSTLTVSLALFLWQFTYCLSGYNRTFEGISVTMLQNAVTYDPPNGDFLRIGKSVDPYFNTTAVKVIVTRYVSDALPKATLGGNYSLDFGFSEYRQRVFWQDHCPAKVTITLEYESAAYSASRSKSFIITEGVPNED